MSFGIGDRAAGSSRPGVVSVVLRPDVAGNKTE